MIGTTILLNIDRIADALYRAGWSMGDACFGRTWLVSGTHGGHGEPMIAAAGRTQLAAWQLAYQHAANIPTTVPFDASFVGHEGAR